MLCPGMTLDHDVLVLVNQRWTATPLDWWGAIVNASELWWPVAVLFVVLAAWRGGARGRMAVLVALLSVGLGDGVLVRVLKTATARPRPAHVLAGVRMVHLADRQPRILAFKEPLRIDITPTGRDAPPPRSFPSGHAWNAFTIATVIALTWRRHGFIAYLPAAATAYARVYVGIHWPSDVLVSALAAPLFTFVLAGLCDQAMLLLPQRMTAAFAPLLAPQAPSPP